MNPLLLWADLGEGRLLINFDTPNISYGDFDSATVTGKHMLYFFRRVILGRRRKVLVAR